MPGATKSIRTILFEHELPRANDAGAYLSRRRRSATLCHGCQQVLFVCAAAASWVNALPTAPDAIHLHDWHAAYYLLQREYSSSAARLKQIRTVFTIHNLAYQGQRPLRGDESSLEAWFRT